MILSSTDALSGADDSSRALTSKKKLDEDLNRFLTLLVTQLQHQDPLDPMDATDFTSQLVQFATVEQAINSNNNLEKLLALHQTSQIASMVNFIDTTIEVDDDRVFLENNRAEFAYKLGSNAADVTITIKNEGGLTVFTATGETGIGSHTFVWDGKTKGGQVQPDGAYTVIINALDRQGNIQDVDQTSFGRVTGAGAEDGKVSLFIGTIVVPMENVISVKETVKIEPVPTT